MKYGIKTKFYVAYYMGEKSNGTAKYSLPLEVYGFISEPKGIKDNSDYGLNRNYERTILLDVGESTLYINELSILWVSTIPNKNLDNYNYVVSRVDGVRNRVLSINVKETPSNSDFIYYLHNGDIITTKVFFVNDNLFSLPKNLYFPINEIEKIWLKQPNDKNDENYLIELVKVEEKYDSRNYFFKGITNEN